MDELLNEILFLSLAHARAMLAEWRTDYNVDRPHSSIGWQTPNEYAATRSIVGWRASTSMKGQFVLDALDRGIWQGKTPDNKSLVRHSDRAAQYLSIK